MKLGRVSTNVSNSGPDSVGGFTLQASATVPVRGDDVDELLAQVVVRGDSASPSPSGADPRRMSAAGRRAG